METRRFLLVFRSEGGGKPSITTAEGATLLDALKDLEKEFPFRRTMKDDLVLAFDMKPENAGVDALQTTVREVVARHLGIAGITD